MMLSFVQSLKSNLYISSKYIIIFLMLTIESQATTLSCPKNHFTQVEKAQTAAAPPGNIFYINFTTEESVYSQIY